jgi:hypothetical protein
MDVTFPSRRLTAALLPTAATLFAAGLALTPWEDERGTAGYHDALAAHPDRSQAAAIVLYLGYLLLVPAAFGLVACAGGRGGWATRIGAVLAVVGLVAMPGLIVTDAFDLALAEGLDREASVAISDAATSKALAIVISAPAGIGLMGGTTLLVAGLWRARRVGAIAPALVLAGWVVPALAYNVVFTVGGALLFLVGCVVVAQGLLRREALGDGQATAGGEAVGSVASATAGA